MNIHVITVGRYQDEKNWPEIWKLCYNSLIKTGYNISIWKDKDVEELLKEDDNEFYENYLSKLDIIYQIDYVRYIILGKYGGAYFDMDVELKVNFLQWLDPSKVYLAEGEGNCLVNNHIMISPNDHIFWYNIRQNLKYRLIERFDKCKKNGYYTIETLGPIGLSYVLAKEKMFYTPLSRYHFGGEETNLRFCIHHYTNEWSKVLPKPFIDFNLVG